MRRLLLILTVLTLIASACGDDSSAVPGLAGDGDGSSSGDGDGGDGGGGDDGGGDGDGGAGGAGSGSDFCGPNDEINAQLDAIDFGSSPDVVESGLRSAYEVMQQAAASAPGEVSDDAGYLVSQYGEFIDYLDGINFNFASIDLNDPSIPVINDPRFEEAVDNLNAFCGADDGGGLPDPGDVPDPGDIDFGDVDPGNPEDIAAVFVQLYGWDAALAQCVVDELGIADPNFSPDFSDPFAEVCGQSLIELFTGATG